MWFTFHQKSNLHYTCGITPNHLTTGGAHLRGLAPGQHSSKETSQQWRAVGYTVSDLTGPVIEPQTSRTNSDGLNNWRTFINMFYKLCELLKFFALFSWYQQIIVPDLLVVDLIC